MNKEIKDRVELSISNTRHVCNNAVNSMGAALPIGADIVYLLEKIEELQSNFDVMKINFNKIKHKPVK